MPAAHVTVVFNPATAPFAGMMVRVIEESAPSLAVAVRAAPRRDDTEIEAMMAGLEREERGGLLILQENSNLVHRDAIETAIALKARLALKSRFTATNRATRARQMAQAAIARGCGSVVAERHQPTVQRTRGGLRRWREICVQSRRASRCSLL